MDALIYFLIEDIIFSDTLSFYNMIDYLFLDCLNSVTFLRHLTDYKEFSEDFLMFDKNPAENIKLKCHIKTQISQ